MKKITILHFFLICSTIVFGQSVTIQPTGGNARDEIKYVSNIGDPHLLLNETGGGVNRYARMTFLNSGYATINNNFWTLAALTDGSGGSHSNSIFNIFYGNNGGGANILSLKGNGKVGIGTSTPYTKLQVHNDDMIASSAIQLTNSGTGSGNHRGLYIAEEGVLGKDAFLNNLENGKLFLGTNDSYNITLTPTGNVGLGTTTPNFNLQVHDAVNNFSNFQLTNTATGALATDGFFMATYNQHAFLTNAENGNLIFSTNNTNRMTILATGEVGIGTTTPTAPLDVLSTNGTIANFGSTFTGANTTTLEFYRNTSTNYAYLGSYWDAINNSIEIGTRTNSGSIIFSTNVLPKMIISPNGNVGIGTGLAAATAKLEVDGFTKLGETTAPAIKMKKITGTTAAAQGGLVSILHGLADSKIIGIEVLVEWDGIGGKIPPSYQGVSGYEYYFSTGSGGIAVYNSPTNSSLVLNKPIKILITYEQ